MNSRDMIFRVTAPGSQAVAKDFQNIAKEIRKLDALSQKFHRSSLAGRSSVAANFQRFTRQAGGFGPLGMSATEALAMAGSRRDHEAQRRQARDAIALERQRAAGLASVAREEARTQRVAARQARLNDPVRLHGIAQRAGMLDAATYYAAGSGAAAFGRAILGVSGHVLKLNSEFEKTMSAVRAFGGDRFAPFMVRFEDQARMLGRTTQFTATEVADAQRQMAQAGMSAEEALGAMPATLSLAAAGSTDLTTAVRIMASSMTQFNIPVKDAANVADLMAQAANASQTDVVGIGSALKMAGGSANQLGFSLKDTITHMALLGKTAVSHGPAGVQMNQVYLGLSKAAGPKYRAELRRMGIDTKLFRENMKNLDLKGMVGQFSDALGKMDPSKRLDILARIFTQRGARGMGALMNLHATGQWDTVVHEMDNAGGAAKKAADILQDNFAGSLLKAKSAAQSLALTVGKGLMPVLSHKLEVGQRLVTEIDTLAGSYSKLVGWLAMTTAEVGLVALGGGKLIQMYAGWRAAMASFGNLSVKNSMAEFRAAGARLPATVSLIAAAFAGFSVGTFIDEITGASDSISDWLLKARDYETWLASKTKSSGTDTGALLAMSKGDRAEKLLFQTTADLMRFNMKTHPSPAHIAVDEMGNPIGSAPADTDLSIPFTQKGQAVDNRVAKQMSAGRSAAKSINDFIDNSLAALARQKVDAIILEAEKRNGKRDVDWEKKQQLIDSNDKLRDVIQVLAEKGIVFTPKVKVSGEVEYRSRPVPVGLEE